MRSAISFLVILLLLLLTLSAYVQILLIGKLPFDPSTIADIMAQAVIPCLVAAAVVLPWRLYQKWRGRFSPVPMLVALVVVGIWQYQFYATLRESIGQWSTIPRRTANDR
jgi:hypothetical protein